jgi:hypothetical protein
MSTSSTIFGEAVWVLPPLILHPFNERVPPSALLENSKAALMLSGLIPSDGSDPDDLKRRLLAGRYSEIRMLFYLGKDVFRWLDQCIECVEHVPELRDADIHRQSFAALLTGGAPQAVKEKLIHWGVSDYVSIFSRAIGLNAMFAEPPPFTSLAEELLRNYHRYADSMFQCYQGCQPHCALTSRNFPFDLYASSEYSRLLESEWGVSEPDS